MRLEVTTFGDKRRKYIDSEWPASTRDSLPSPSQYYVFGASQILRPHRCSYCGGDFDLMERRPNCDCCGAPR